MSITLIEALLIGLWTGICWSGMLLGTYTFRSLILATGVGFILGDVQTGLMIGAIAELAFMGFGVGAGGTVPPSPLGPGIVGSIMAIRGGVAPEVAFTLSIPFAVAFQFVQTSLYVLLSGNPEMAKKAVEKGQFGKFRLIANSTVFLFIIFGFILGFSSAMASDAIKQLVAFIPQDVIKALTLAGKMLPAIGFATILSVMAKKELIPYMIIGYVLMAYLKLPEMSIALVGTACALYVFNKKDEVKVVNESEEFEDGI